jgi:hypothetical protein
MEGAYSVCEEEYRCIWWGNQREGKYLQVLGIDGIIISNWIFNK